MSAKTRFARERPFAAHVYDSVSDIGKALTENQDAASREISTTFAIVTVAYALLDLSDGVRGVATAIRETKEHRS